ncbi:MAG: hypothetical protein R3D66_01130 [Alphaproteobacteria bacterium]
MINPPLFRFPYLNLFITPPLYRAPHHASQADMIVLAVKPQIMARNLRRFKTACTAGNGTDSLYRGW